MNGQHLRKRDEEIIRLYSEEGLTVKEIGPLFGLTHVRVIQILEKAGVNRRSRGWRSHWPWRDMEQRRREIAHVYVEEELSLNEVGARLGLSTSCVRQELIRAGVDRRHASWYRMQRVAQRNREIIRLCLQEGLKRKEVAARFDLRPETISRILAKEKMRGSQPDAS